MPDADEPWFEEQEESPRQPCLDDDGGPLVQVELLVRHSGEDDFYIGAVSKVLVRNEGGGGVADGLEVTEDLILIRMI